jgi:hypothetical protein
LCAGGLGHEKAKALPPMLQKGRGVDLIQWRVIHAPGKGLRRDIFMLNLTAFRATLGVLGILLGGPALAQSPQGEPAKPDIDLYAHMSGNCRKLKSAGHDFACKVVAYFHSERGRASFTVALDDPADESHVIAFSGEYGHRTQENLYVLAVDRMELKSKDHPKSDGLPIPSVERSDGVCRQFGNFATRLVTSISCSATDRNGKSYELQFESDGSPIALHRVRLSAPTVRMDPYR